MNFVAETLIVVDRPNPVDGEREILVGQQKRGEWGSLLNFPGGKAEVGELLADAAVRELEEETGVTLRAEQLVHLGNLIINDYRPNKRRFGTVAIFGAHLGFDPTVTPKADEFDCFWVKPTDRNILLNMPRDIGYWLPLVFQTEDTEPFVCVRTVDEGGGDWYETARLLPGQQTEPVTEFAVNL